jgi:hypothetical protein
MPATLSAIRLLAAGMHRDGAEGHPAQVALSARILKKKYFCALA